MGYALVGLDGAAEETLAPALSRLRRAPLGLVLGAEGPGMRELTTKLCDRLARIPAAGDFGSLNVSNAAAVALYAATSAAPETYFTFACEAFSRRRIAPT